MLGIIELIIATIVVLVNVSIVGAAAFGNPFIILIAILAWSIPGIILIFIGILKWNSEQEKAETLKSRAKVHINVKGKMKDL
jgi:hypothetical protein